MILPSTKNLIYLVAVAKYLSFSIAAKHCFVTQSTLSNGIKKLEQDLNIVLIERDNKSIIFTKVGRQVVLQAKKILENSRYLVSLTKENFYEGSLNIGIIPTIAPFLLQSFLIKTQETYPRLRINIVESQSYELLKKIDNMEIEFAILALPFDIPDNLHKQSLYKDDLCCVTYKDRENTTAASKELLLLEQGHCLREHIINNSKINNYQISNSSYSNLETLVLMINMQKGISFIPKMAINTGIIKQYPNLVISNNYQKISREIGIVYKKNNYNQNHFLKLMELLKKVPSNS